MDDVSEKNKYDGHEQEVGTFMRKLYMQILGKKVQEKLVKGENLTITEASNKEELKKLFNKELMAYQHRSDAGVARMAEIPVFQVWLEEARQTLYKWLMFNTKDEALAEVTKNGWEKVHLTIGDIKRIHC